MSLVARQHDGEIKLTWTYTPSFWLEFEPLFIEQVGGLAWTLTTQTVTIPQDCGLWMNIETALLPAVANMNWYRNDEYIQHDAANNWGNPYVEFLQGDSLYIKGGNYSSNSDFIGTVKLHLNSPDGVVVAQFDFNLPMMPECFLTTAMVDYYGKSDNGPELTAMRKLREHYIDKPGYKELIDEYYHLSAQIIKAIEAEKDPGAIYSAIYESVKTCENAVASGHWAKAHDEYLSMYYRLVEKYCPDRKGAIVDDVKRRR